MFVMGVRRDEHCRLTHTHTHGFEFIHYNDGYNNKNSFFFASAYAFFPFHSFLLFFVVFSPLSPSLAFNYRLETVITLTTTRVFRTTTYY